MAEIGVVSGKGRQEGSGVSAVSGASGISKSAGRRVSNGKTWRRAAKETKPRRRKVKGYGVDLLRAAAERRMAESSKELAESLMSKALAGKMDSVKILMKLAEEEKARKEEEREEGEPTLCDVLIGPEPGSGPVWERRRQKAAAIKELWNRRRAEEDEFEKRRWDDLEEAA